MHWQFGEMEFGEMKRNTSNWSNIFPCFYVARVWQRQLGFLVLLSADVTVRRIIHRDLALKCFKRRRAHGLTAANKLFRLTRAQQLLRRFSKAEQDFIWFTFTDEKVFTVSAPKNTQNDRVYAPVNTAKRHIAPERLLRERPTFSKSVTWYLLLCRNSGVRNCFCATWSES